MNASTDCNYNSLRVCMLLFTSKPYSDGNSYFFKVALNFSQLQINSMGFMSELMEQLRLVAGKETTALKRLRNSFVTMEKPFENSGTSAHV